MTAPEFLNLAQIVAPMGVQGELKVRPETDDPLRLKDLKEVRVLRRDGTDGMLGIASVRLRKDGVLLVKFTGYDSPEAAGELRQAWLQIPFSQAKRKPGKVLYADVLGMRVVDEAGTEIGVVREVLRAAQDLLEIRRAGGDDVLLPWVEVFVKNIDLAERLITVSPPEGLFE